MSDARHPPNEPTVRIWSPDGGSKADIPVSRHAARLRAEFPATVAYIESAAAQATHAPLLEARRTIEALAPVRWGGTSEDWLRRDEVLAALSGPAQYPPAKQRTR